MSRPYSNLFLLILTFFTVSSLHHAQALNYLIVPTVHSISDIRIAERVAKLLHSSGNKVAALIHSLDSQNWHETSAQKVSYGNADELQSVLKNVSLQNTINKIVIDQIEKDDIVNRLSKNGYHGLVCNVEDEICRYINHNLKFDKKIFYIATCPKNWEDVFGSFPTKKGHFSRAKDVLKDIFSFFFPAKKSTIPLQYQYDALYLSECFPPLYSPVPNLENIFPIGSLLGESPQKELPDQYRKPMLIASKMVLVSLGDDEATDTGLLLDMMKTYPTYLFVVVSKTFEIGDYALGNVIVDENAPINELLTHNKMTLFISNGEWTLLLNALYHGVPVITIGRSNEGVIGRQLVSSKNLGVDLSQKKYTSLMIEDNIRELVFNGVYKKNVKEIANYLKGLNNNHLIPPVINRFEPAKEWAKDL